jgi:Protein of unknown function (DUF1217)
MDPTITNLGIPTGVAGWKLLQGKTAANFPALTSDPVVTREIAYFEANAPKATTASALLANPRLQNFVLTAYGLTSENGMTALMTKVLNSDPANPKSFAAQMVNSAFTQIATAFNYGGSETPAQPPTASSAEVNVNGLFQASTFGTFSGTFGGVAVSNVDLTGATTWQGLASAVQTAFRSADGNRTDISVTLDGPNLVFTDDKGRGTASGFTWTANPANTEPNPTASSPVNLVAGAPAKPQVGGPAVTSPSFIAQVVQKYTEAQLEQVVGDTSNVLRQARYAQQHLPSITNWNSIIASPPLANVIQTVLGLPPSFGALNIAQQAQVYSQKMNIANFQNPTKLASLLNQYVAMASASSPTSASSPALQLLNASSSSSGIVSLILPTAATSTTTTNDSYSSASMAVMLLGAAANG